MQLPLLFLIILFALNIALDVRTPLYRQETQRRMLIRQKRWTELRQLNHNIMDALRKGGQRMDSANQTLYNFADQEFNMLLMIGTPPQKFMVLPDTTESNLWITDQTCNGYYIDCPDYCYATVDWCKRYCDPSCCQNRTHVFDSLPDPCSNKTKFHSNKSSTYQSDGRTFHIPTGIGNVSGILGVDTVSLGSDKRSLPIPGTTFGQANKLSVHFTLVPVDGVFGLGFQKSAVDNIQTPLERAIQLGLFDEPVFSVFIQEEGYLNDTSPLGGFILFGGQDTVHCAAFNNHIPLVSDSAWQFNIDAVGPNGELRDGPFLTTISIGSSITIGPTETLMDLVTALNAQYNFDLGLYTIDCSTKFKWTFKARGAEFNVDGKNLMWPFEGDQCILTYNGWDTPDGVRMILGLSVAHQYCLLFDFGQKRLGIAPHL